MALIFPGVPVVFNVSSFWVGGAYSRKKMKTQQGYFSETSW